MSAKIGLYSRESCHLVLVRLAHSLLRKTEKFRKGIKYHFCSYLGV